MSDLLLWFKVKITKLDEESIKIIKKLPNGDSILMTWIDLLYIATKKNAQGFIYIKENLPYDIESLSSVLGRDITHLKFSLGVLAKYEIITLYENGIIQINEWDDFVDGDKIDKIKELNRNRKQKQRERERLAKENLNCLTLNCDMSRDQSREITQQDKEEDKEEVKVKEEVKDKEQKKEKIKKKEENSEKRERFSSPTLEMVIAYFLTEKNLNESEAEYRANRFVEFYESKGWMIGKSKMVNWHAAASKSLEWEDKRQQTTRGQPGRFGYNNVDADYVMNKVMNS